MRHWISSTTWAVALMLLIGTSSAWSMPNRDPITNIVSTPSAMHLREKAVIKPAQQGERRHRLAFLNPLRLFKRKPAPMSMKMPHEAPPSERISEAPMPEMPQGGMGNPPGRSTMSAEKIGEITRQNAAPPTSMDAFRDKNADPKKQIGKASDSKEPNPAPTPVAPAMQPSNTDGSAMPTESPAPGVPVQQPEADQQ